MEGRTMPQERVKEKKRNFVGDEIKKKRKEKTETEREEIEY